VSVLVAVGIFLATLVLVIWQPKGLGIGWSALGGAVVALIANVIEWTVQYRSILVSAAWDLLPPTPWFAHVWGQLPTVAAQVVLYPGELVGPLTLEARCDTLRDGIADETSRVWDATGRLVASARQTAVLVA
jgi:hypothetical protein